MKARLGRLSVILALGLLLFRPSTIWGLDSEAGNQSFDFHSVIDIAAEMSKKGFDPSDDQVPKFLLDISYDQWRDIRFKTEYSLWRQDNLPFEIQFFHPGGFYNHVVDIHVIDGNEVKAVPFSPDLFNYGQNSFKDKIPKNLGFAGFRIHYPMNTDTYKDEVAVFLGASYFRAIAKHQQYGLSARGLAIDTGLDSGEEFPFFRTFWLVKPDAGATQLVFYALLDSKSYTGAYEFVLRPGEETVLSVNSRLFQRQPVKKLGIAPLTSMFYYGENTAGKPDDDFRPEVHDSDGLLVAFSSGEWIWHPLQNPKTLCISTFNAPNPAGFGVLQRDLNFDHYQDLETRYDRRPSAWVSPREGDWGSGHVELVLIPSGNEINDNVVAFWVPEIGTDKKKLKFSYDINWYYPRGSPHGGGYTVNTYSAHKKKRTTLFLIDFTGGRLEELGPEAYPTAMVSAGDSVSIVEQRVQRNPFIEGWRLIFRLQGKDQNTIEKVLTSPAEPVNLRAFMRLGNDVLTETWSYTYFP